MSPQTLDILQRSFKTFSGFMKRNGEKKKKGFNLRSKSRAACLQGSTTQIEVKVPSNMGVHSQ